MENVPPRRPRRREPVVVCNCTSQCRKIVSQSTQRRHRRNVASGNLLQNLTALLQPAQQGGLDPNHDEEMPSIEEIVNRLDALQREEAQDIDQESESEDEEPDDAYLSDDSDHEVNLEHNLPQQQPPAPASTRSKKTLPFESPLLSQPLYHGSPITLSKFLLNLLSWASVNKISLVALEEILKFLALHSLPKENLLPPTVHRLYKCLGISPDDYEQHVCADDCQLFPQLDRSEWKNHLADRCQCGKPRFHVKGTTITPAKKFYSLPLAPQLENLLRQPQFVDSLKKMKAALEEGLTCHESFWGGSLVEALVAEPDFLDDFTKILVLSIGLDGVCCFKKEAYSIWPIGVKIWNLHPEERTSKAYILLSAIIPGPDAPKNFAPYLQPLFEEILASQEGEISVDTPEGESEKVTFKLVTVEQDQPALAKTTEIYGQSARSNCWRCRHLSVVNPETGGGAYQTGYITGMAFAAERKTDQEAREHSGRVARKEEDGKEYGIGPPSTFATNFSEFNIIQGFLIDFFHKFDINIPTTVWKDHIFKAYKEADGFENYMMSNQNRKIFSARISHIIPTHDMGKKPRDPSSKRMKGDDWKTFIITCSVYASEGLIPDAILETWCHYRSGYIGHLEGERNATVDAEASEHLRQFGIKLERNFPITACTISVHLSAVEAAPQIPFAGPIKESQCLWVERLNFNLIEQTQRRRVCYAPEKSIFRGFLVQHFVNAHKDQLIPLHQTSSSERGVYDDGDGDERLLGKGIKYTLTQDEHNWVTHFFRYNFGQNQQIPKECYLFKRALFQTEIHSEAFTGTRTRCSHHVELTFEDDATLTKNFYGIIHKFLLMQIGEEQFRLAVNTTFPNLAPSRHGVLRINRTRPYMTGKVVFLRSISRKVIFVGEPNVTSVLFPPLHLSS